ncbi:hypothetical protein G9A89_020895 [Geosiphon pyriformis]|nr:hypothetical protein G9A89_020895 [Geosiphon pyriformis]
MVSRLWLVMQLPILKILIKIWVLELMAIALALECVLLWHSCIVHTDSSAVISMCQSGSLVLPHFKNKCWIEKKRIDITIASNELNVGWTSNVMADLLAGEACSSIHVLSSGIPDSFFHRYVSVAIFSNVKHFIHGLCDASSCAKWKLRFVKNFFNEDLVNDIDWDRTVAVWHPDWHFGSGHTSAKTTGLRTYFIKGLHGHLVVAKHKCRYNANYASVACIKYGDCESSDHTFVCASDVLLWKEDLSDLASHNGLFDYSGAGGLYTALMKGLVIELSLWFCVSRQLKDHKFSSLHVECEKNGTLPIGVLIGSRDEVAIIKSHGFRLPGLGLYMLGYLQKVFFYFADHCFSYDGLVALAGSGD